MSHEGLPDRKVFAILFSSFLWFVSVRCSYITCEKIIVYLFLAVKYFYLPLCLNLTFPCFGDSLYVSTHFLYGQLIVNLIKTLCMSDIDTTKLSYQILKWQLSFSQHVLTFKVYWGNHAIMKLLWIWSDNGGKKLSHQW